MIPSIKRRFSRLVVPIIVVLCSSAATAPFFFSHIQTGIDGQKIKNIVATHDLGMHLFTMEQFDQGLRSGVMYPRWMPDINHGYGILTLIYYPPGFFYLTSAAHLLLNDWLDALFLVCIVTLAFSGLALYKLARCFYSANASLIAAVFYMLLPLHTIDLYWRGSLPQYVGYIFPPLVIYFGYKLGRSGGAVNYAGFALFYGMHLLVNLPVGMMFSYALAFFAVVWALRERDWKIGIRLAAAMSLGLLLSALYWFPAALESKYAYEYASAIFPYHQSYLTLIPTDHAGQYVEFGEVLYYIFTVNALAIIVLILVLRKVAHKRAYRRIVSKRWTPLSMWIAMAIATAFMTSSYSIYVSRLLPKIQTATPAWRWLALSGVFVSLILARTIDVLRRWKSLSPSTIWLLRAAVFAVIAANIWVSVRWCMIRPLNNELYKPMLIADVIESSWTPQGSTIPEKLPDNDRITAVPASAAIEIERWDPQLRIIHIKTDQETTTRFKTYNFPGWRAKIDGKSASMLSDSDGIQQIVVPAGIHTVEASFENTWPRNVGGLLSAIGFVTIVILAVLGLRQRFASEGISHSIETSAIRGVSSSIEKVSRLLKRISARKVINLAVALIIVLIVIVVIVILNIRSGTSPSPSSNPQRSASQALLTPGSEVRLFIQGREWIPLASDRSSLGTIISGLSNPNSPEIESLIAARKMYKIDNDTKARILEATAGSARVRIQEGEHVMVEGWVAERWLR